MHYTQINSKYVCGIDLHAREMYACVMNEKGEILFHRNMRTDFDQFKKKMKPFLPDLAGGVYYIVGLAGGMQKSIKIIYLK